MLGHVPRVAVAPLGCGVDGRRGAAALLFRANLPPHLNEGVAHHTVRSTSLDVWSVGR